MIWHIARRELHEHVRSARFLTLCGLALLLLPLSAHVNVAHYGARLAQTAELRAAQQRRIAEPVTESGAYASRYGWRDGETIPDPALRALRGPSRFAVLAMGADGALPAYWQFGTEGVEAGPAASVGSAAGVGMDAVFIVQVVLGLLALLLVFDAISGERESGVLRLLLSAPVPRGDLLLGKALGAALTLALPLVLGLAGALVVTEVQGGSLLRDGGGPRLAVFLAASVLYLLHMVALGLAVSSMTARPKSSWVIVLLLWIGLVLVAPRAAEMVAATLEPVPPAFEMRQARASGIRQLQAERARTLSRIWESVAGVDSVPERHVPRTIRDAYREASAETERIFSARKRAMIRQLDLDRTRRAERHARVLRHAARLSPASSYAALAADLGGTGRDAADRWLEQVAAHQERLEVATFDRMFGLELFPRELGFLRIIWWPDLADAADRPPGYAELPAFAYRETPLEAVLAGAIPEMGVLAAGAMAWLLVAMAAFQRAEIQ